MAHSKRVKTTSSTRSCMYRYKGNKSYHHITLRVYIAPQLHIPVAFALSRKALQHINTTESTNSPPSGPGSGGIHCWWITAHRLTRPTSHPRNKTFHLCHNTLVSAPCPSRPPSLHASVDTTSVWACVVNPSSNRTITRESIFGLTKTPFTVG